MKKCFLNLSILKGFLGNGFTIENLTIRKDLSGLEGNYFGGLLEALGGK